MNPSPAEIRAWRKAERLSARAAAELVYSSTRAWQQWETPPENTRDHRPMHRALWDLVRIRRAAQLDDWDEVRAILVADPA